MMRIDSATTARGETTASNDRIGIVRRIFRIAARAYVPGHHAFRTPR